MNYFISTFICFICTLNSYAQNFADTVLYNSEFKWSIVIPEGFYLVSVDSVNAMHKRGAQKLENSSNQKIEDNTTNIFMFKSNRFNYFESCSQPYDTTTDGKISESVKLIANVLYNSFTSQIKNVEIDSSFEIEKISGLEFHKLKMKIKYPNNLVFYINMYCRLFGNKELAINIYYVDEIKGYQMLNAWKKSKFHD